MAAEITKERMWQERYYHTCVVQVKISLVKLSMVLKLLVPNPERFTLLCYGFLSKALSIAFLATISILDVRSQSITLHSQVVFPTVKDTSEYIRFTINNQHFGEKDTTIQIQIHVGAFDTCEAAFGADTMKFLAKFKEGEVYEIRQGCCCAAFTLEPRKNPRRGNVTFMNTTERDLGLVVAEANVDTVKSKQSKTIFSYESALWLFKPCNIAITETDYLSDKYNHKNDERNYDSLWQEQAQFMLAQSWFHFMHGEKIEISYREKNISMKLIGYMTEEEYKDVWK